MLMACCLTLCEVSHMRSSPQLQRQVVGKREDLHGLTASFSSTLSHSLWLRLTVCTATDCKLGFCQCAVYSVSQSCPTRSNLMDCSLPGSSAHGIFQARALEWGAIAFCNVRDYAVPKKGLQTAGEAGKGHSTQVQCERKRPRSCGWQQFKGRKVSRK